MHTLEDEVRKTMKKEEISLLQRKIKLSAVQQGYPLTLAIPNNMMIELTNACNLKCSMCYHKKMKRKSGFMTKELFTKIIDQAISNGIQNVGLYTVGESLLHPEIFDFIALAKEKGIEYVYLTTSGLLLDKARCRKMIDSELDSIKFSIDAGSKATYEREKSGASWDKLVDNVKTLKAMRDADDSRMRIFGSFVVSDSNYSEIVNYNNIFSELLDESMFYFALNQGGQQEEFVNLPELKTVKDKIKERISNGEAQRSPCSFLWNRFIITYDGLLTICCVDFEARLIYGDLKKNTLVECWNNPRIQGYRKIHRDRNFKVLPLCADCDTYKINQMDILLELQNNIGDISRGTVSVKKED